MDFLNSKALGGNFAVQTARPLEWLFLLGAFVVLGAGIFFLRSQGKRSRARGIGAVAQEIDSGAERTTEVAAWASTAVLTGIWALLVAFIGFVWDVGWHADAGRDQELFTVPHMLILVGLGGIAAAALVSIWSATRNTVNTGWRIGRWHVPYSSVPLFAIGGGALLGFPLDNLWHAAYGIDVTMWSPTHLLMIGGASLSPLPMWLMLSEAGAPKTGRGRLLWASMAGVVLVGLSTFQLEFDMGIPQWQAFYHPLLIASATGIGLVAARVAIGKGGALMAAASFLTLRGLMALLVGGVLGRSLPHFPLYLGGALCVEAAFLVLRNRSVVWQSLFAGLLLATVGLATEAVWTHLWFPYPWQTSLLPFVWMFVAIVLPSALVGLAAGTVLTGRAAPVRAPIIAVCLVAIFGLLLSHAGSRHADPGKVTLNATTVGTPSLLVNRDGVPTTSRDVTLTVRVDPPDAVANSDAFEALAWQGGPPVRHFRLVQTAPGEYRAEGVIPTGGNWKSLVILNRGDVVAAVPVAFPADPAYALAAIEPPDMRTADLQPSSRFLMREFTGTVGPLAIIISALFVLIVFVWVASTALAFRAVGRRLGPPPKSRRQQLRVRAPATGA